MKFKSPVAILLTTAPTDATPLANTTVWPSRHVAHEFVERTAGRLAKRSNKLIRGTVRFVEVHFLVHDVELAVLAETCSQNIGESRSDRTTSAHEYGQGAGGGFGKSRGAGSELFDTPCHLTVDVPDMLAYGSRLSTGRKYGQSC